MKNLFKIKSNLPRKQFNKKVIIKIKFTFIINGNEDISIAHSGDHFEREKIISIAVNRSKQFYKKSYYETVIYVGDRHWDKKAASNFGIGFIGIGDEFEMTDDKGFMHVTSYINLQLEKWLDFLD